MWEARDTIWFEIFVLVRTCHAVEIIAEEKCLACNEIEASRQP